MSEVSAEGDGHGQSGTALAAERDSSHSLLQESWNEKCKLSNLRREKTSPISESWPSKLNYEQSCHEAELRMLPLRSRM